MNRGLNFYGIILLTIATILVFSLTDFGVVYATTGIDLDNNPAQSNQVPDLKSDPNDNEESANNNNNNNANDNPNNDDTNSDQSSPSITSASNTNNDDTNSDQSSTSTTSTSTTSTSTTSTSTSTPTTTSNDNVPMSLPFNSHMADESNDETDYSSIIPFP